MRKENFSLWRLFLFLFFLSIALYWGDKKGWYDSVRGRLEQGIIKFSKKNQNLNVDEFKKINLEAKILSLENKIETLSQENKDLKKQLQSPLPAFFKFIPAEIISVEKKGKRNREMLIAVGKDTGVKVGMPVVLENILLGQIKRTSPKLSQVRLLDSLESKITVRTGRNQARGILKLDNKVVVLDKVLQSEKISKGDKVLTSGEDGLPPGLLIGKISNVIFQEQEPFKKAEVELFLKPEKLERVFIITNF